MRKLTDGNLRSKFLLLVALAVAMSLFLAGSGFAKVNGARFSRSSSKHFERERWGTILNSMSLGIPEARREAWRVLASENPELLMRVVSEWR